MYTLPNFTTVPDPQQPYQQGGNPCTATVSYYLSNIQRHSQLNAFVRTYPAEARARATALDEKLKAGKAGKLAGLVAGLKDLICYQDHPIQASSKILAGFISQFSATATQRLLDADAIIIGHQNCDEFGMGSSNENSAWGPVLHPIDPTRVPGGSSGGSAAAVQARMCQVSLGTDTGGSVRQPAAFCGIIGLKPTYARISRHGLIAYASSFDTIGILANHIRDCAAVLEVIAGPDDFDSTVARHPVPTYTAHLHWDRKAKIAYLPETLAYAGLQEEIRARTWGTIDTLRQEGHPVEKVDFPLLEYALPTYYVLTNAEASANLARFDGVRYGYKSPAATTLEEMYKKTRSEALGEEVQRRILLGTFVLSDRRYEACYVKAQQVRRLIQQQLEAILSAYDFIILPTTPTTAFKLGSHVQDPISLYWADLYTTLASIAGLPAISIPNGADRNKLPIGLQIITKAFAEPQLLSFSQYLLQLTKQGHA
ncbi:MAG: Asp-tRNA(Asn)/Glu-tRNA(Gln) amidotransferase subunit GatA [Bacteroidota bacterium]